MNRLITEDPFFTGVSELDTHLHSANKFGQITSAVFSILLISIVLFMILSLIGLHFTPSALADGARLPGEDAATKMESAGTLLRFIDTGLFKWAARILAGLCIFGAGWNLKEMRFGPAIISLIAAILFGTAPTWVKNIFSIGGSDSVFSKAAPQTPAKPTGEETYDA